jgi:hypothetical protein
MFDAARRFLVAFARLDFRTVRVAVRVWVMVVPLSLFPVAGKEHAKAIPQSLSPAAYRSADTSSQFDDTSVMPARCDNTSVRQMPGRVHN